jgi:hypothetical protein
MHGGPTGGATVSFTHGTHKPYPRPAQQVTPSLDASSAPAQVVDDAAAGPGPRP